MISSLKRSLQCMVCFGLLVCISLLQVQAQTEPASNNASAPKWATLKAAYDYDKKKKVEFTTTPKDNIFGYVEEITFPSPSGDKVTGVFGRPKEEGKYPCILLLHGYTANKESIMLQFAINLVKQGFAVLALDAPRHGGRRTAQGLGEFKDFFQITRDGCVDYRIALDWLGKRKDVDSSRIGLIGYSMGAMMGAVLGGVDSRVKALVLCVGGDVAANLMKIAKDEDKEKLAISSPSLFIGHIAPRPVLLLNGKNDTVVKPETTKLLMNAAKEPKEIIWYDAGHLLPGDAYQKAADWLKNKFKPTAKP